MNARDVAIAVVALLIGCLGPTAVLTAGLRRYGAAPVIVGALIAAAVAGKRRQCYFAAMTRTRFRNRNANCCEIDSRS